MSTEIEDIKKEYLEQFELFNDMEIQKAPSGEWDEHNVHFLVQQGIVNTFEEILIMLGEQDFIDEQYGEES